MFSKDSFDEELSNDEIIEDHKTILNFQNLTKQEGWGWSGRGN